MDNKFTLVQNIPNQNESQHPTQIENPMSLDYFINENKLLRIQMSFYQQEHSKAKEVQFALEQKNKILIEEKELLQSQINHYKTANQKHLESTTHLQNDIERAINELSIKQDEIHKMQIAINSKDKSIFDYKNQIISLNQLLNDKDTSLSQHAFTIDKLTASNKDFEAKIAQLETEISNVNHKHTMTEQQLQSQLRLTKENGELMKIDKETIKQKESYVNDLYSKLQQDYSILSQKLSLTTIELNKQIKSLKDINQIKDGQISQIDLASKEKQFKIEELMQSLEQLNKTQFQIQNESNFLKEMINDKEAEIKRLKEYKRKYETIEFYDKSTTSIKPSHLNNSITDIEFIKDEYQKLRLIHNQTKYERDNLFTNNKLLNIQLKEYQELKEQSKENEAKINEYSSMKNSYAKQQKELNELAVENNIYKERLEVISIQNRRLLLKSEIDFCRTNPNYLSQSLNESNYEKFLYNNIEDLESKINNAIQSNIEYQNEIKALKESNAKYSKDIEENNQLIKSMENYVKGLEVVNLSQQEENGQMKRTMTSSFYVWNDIQSNEDKSKLSSHRNNEQSQELKMQGLQIKNNELIEKDKLSQNELALVKQQLRDETERSERQHNDIIKLNETILQYQNQLGEKSKEVTMLMNQKNNVNNQLKEKVANGIESERKIGEMSQMVTMLQSDKSQLNRVIEEMLKGNNDKINQTKVILETKMENVIEENKQMKTIIDFIQTSVKEIITPLAIDNNHRNRPLTQQVQQENQSNSSIIKDNSNSDSKNTLLQKQKEFIELKQQLDQMKITIENISTENSMLKYKETFYNKRTSPVPVFNQSNLFHYTPSLNQPESTLNTSLTNTNNSQLEENYLKVVNENKDLQTNILILQNKIKDLTMTNSQLISGDINAPFKVLINQIDELTQTVASLKITNENLIKEKESIISNYSFLNLTNESLKEKQIQLEAINYNLMQEKFSLSDKLQKYSREIDQLKQKDNIIQQRDDTIQAKDKEINNLQSKTDDLYIAINKLENEKNDYNDHEKFLKEEIEMKKKEVFESKSKSFKNFYLIFKKSRQLIPFLNTLNVDLEEQMNEVQKAKISLNDKINALELKNVAMESLVKDKEKIIHDLRNEIAYLKESNAQMGKEILLIEVEAKKEQQALTPNEQDLNQVNVGQLNQNQPPKIHKGPNLKEVLFSKMKKCQYIITFLNTKVALLEKEKEKETESGLANNACNDHLNEINSLKEVISAKDKTIQDLRFNLNQFTFKQGVMSKDVDTLSLFIKENFEDNVEGQNTNSNNSNSIKNKSDIEKSKAFTALLFKLRKAMKIISYLTKQ